MNQVIARVSIRFYRDMLLSDIRPEERSRVHKLLIAEEDKLGKDLKLLADIEWYIAESARRIEAQQSHVRAIQANGHDSNEALDPWSPRVSYVGNRGDVMGTGWCQTSPSIPGWIDAESTSLNDVS